MPRKCCVPNCRGNYNPSEIVSVFEFPSDLERRNLWKRKIPRDNFEPSRTSVVCERHFCNEFILTKDSVTRPDGTVLTVERSRPRLTKDAFPSIFPNCPSYLSCSVNTLKRKAPEERRSDIKKRDEDAFNQWCERDKIKDYSEFCNTFTSKIDGNIWMFRIFSSSSSSSDAAPPSSADYCTLYRIHDAVSTAPILITSIKIFMDMHVEVFNDTGKVPDSALVWIFESSPSLLKLWSQFDTLVSHFSTRSGFCGRPFKDQLTLHVSAIDDLCSDASSSDGYDEEETESKSLSCIHKIMFLVEQLKLVHSSAIRYSCSTLLWAFRVFASAPRAYCLIRKSDVLTLPHPSYLRRISSVFVMGSGFPESQKHIAYLRERCNSMEYHQQEVILMMDEIHLAHQLSYKGGKLEGAASNCQVSEASTAQVFMISSVLSKQKDVVAIVPVKNIDAKYLEDLLKKTLQILHNVGFRVLCVISDNNRINRNAFTNLCGGKLVPSISNPIVPSERLFFLFDTVHLFKCIRNNWLSQSDPEQTFRFPSLSTLVDESDRPSVSVVDESESPSVSVVRASLSHIKKVYGEEKSSLIKLAPSLTQKCLTPTSTEKQSVSLMLRIFDRQNALALKFFGPKWRLDVSGTIDFLLFIVQMWNVLNVKHPYKGRRLLNERCKPVTSTLDSNFSFLQDALSWFTEWNRLGFKPRHGVLSVETMDALLHTLRTFLELVQYLLFVKKFKYVLLGKFQTDDLEFRFSQYRQMSGCNYQVSVQQLLEGEKKLKLLSVLKFVSASGGSLKLKDITEPLEEIASSDSSCDDDFQYFVPLLSDCDDIELSSEQLKALVFVCGYCSRKALLHVNCDVCKYEFKQDRVLNVESTEESLAYISSLDRGGLTWPADFAVEIMSHIFRVFQLLIGSHENEQRLLSSTNQRGLLMKLTMQRLEEEGLLGKHCRKCGKDLQDYVQRFCKPAVNIFLNNYSKMFTDKVSTTKAKRKLQTLTKRA